MDRDIACVVLKIQQNDPVAVVAWGGLYSDQEGCCCMEKQSRLRSYEERR